MKTSSLREAGIRPTVSSAICMLISLLTAASAFGDELPTLDNSEAGQISVGYDHTCAVKRNGKVQCWGRNARGEISPPSERFRAVSGGKEFTCGIRASGEVQCWGKDVYVKAKPSKGKFIQISAGHNHACGRKDSGEVECWGRDESGEATPPSAKFTHISAGGRHTCGLKRTGEVECWGAKPVVEGTPSTGEFTQISAGGSHTCGVKSSGEVACWGPNNWDAATPPEGKFIQVGAGAKHTCGVRPGGHVECWGYNFYGQAKQKVGDYVRVDAGATHTCGVEKSGEIKCWGDRSDGRLGPDTPDKQYRDPSAMDDADVLGLMGLAYATPFYAVTAISTDSYAKQNRPQPVAWAAYNTLSGAALTINGLLVIRLSLKIASANETGAGVMGALGLIIGTGLTAVGGVSLYRAIDSFGAEDSDRQSAGSQESQELPTGWSVINFGGRF